MVYQVNGKDNNEKYYSTRIRAKSPLEAKKKATGNIIQIVTSVISLDESDNIKNSWKVKNGKLVKAI